MSKDMDRLSEENYRQRNESYIKRLRDEREKKLRTRYEELRNEKKDEKNDE
jgi:hypothetical protein